MGYITTNKQNIDGITLNKPSIDAVNLSPIEYIDKLWTMQP